jgi:hypothetical protein
MKKGKKLNKNKVGPIVQDYFLVRAETRLPRAHAQLPVLTTLDDFNKWIHEWAYRIIKSKEERRDK